MRLCAAHIGTLLFHHLHLNDLLVIHHGRVNVHRAHALQLWAIKSIPEFVRDRLLLSMHLGIRSKGMKKEADKQA
jgi:hypothetical protein